jgi:23S rRNA pseudouridine1911/1915/1917 synthase
MQQWTTVFENEAIIILDKPCGIALQAVNDDILKYYKINNDIELHPITRIDQPVSGLCLLAKNKNAAAHYTHLIQNDKIKKTYVAVVEGKFPTDVTRIESHLTKKGNKAIEDNKNGKLSILNILSVFHLERYSILSLSIETGRFHQVRAQLSLQGFPVKGDLKYNSKRSNEGGGIYLHCDMIKILIDNEEMIFNAPFPEGKPLYKLGFAIG